MVNEGLEMQQGGGGRVKSGKKKGAKAASTNTEDHSGRGQVGRVFFPPAKQADKWESLLSAASGKSLAPSREKVQLLE